MMNKTKKLAVIFPGIGYHTDKPLLYYSKKIARQHDFEIVEVGFHGLDTAAPLDRKTMLYAFALASMEVQEQLEAVDFASYDEVVFVSKSIGTVAASVYAARNHVHARQVYFTPLEQTFSLVEEGNGLVFFGEEDPLIKVE